MSLARHPVLKERGEALLLSVGWGFFSMKLPPKTFPDFVADVKILVSIWTSSYDSTQHFFPKEIEIILFFHGVLESGNYLEHLQCSRCKTEHRWPRLVH